MSASPQGRSEVPARAQARTTGLPAQLRVRRDHGNGLWTFEDETGQLYLAVKAQGFIVAPAPKYPIDSTDPVWLHPVETHGEEPTT